MCKIGNGWDVENWELWWEMEWPGVNAKQSMLSGGWYIKNAAYHHSKTVSGAQQVTKGRGNLAESLTGRQMLILRLPPITILCLVCFVLL